MKKARFVIMTVDGPRKIDGYIDQVDGFWFGFKKWGKGKDTHWTATDLLTGSSVNGNHKFYTKKEAAEHCRTIVDDVQKMLTSGNSRVEEMKNVVEREYYNSNDAEMYRRLYGDWM